MNEKAQGLLILIAVVGTAGGAYALAYRGKSPAVRRGASWVVAAIFAVAGLWGLWAYAIPFFIEGLHDPTVPRWVAVIGAFVIAVFCVVPWAIAVRFATSAMRKDSSPQASAARSPEASPGTKPRRVARTTDFSFLNHTHQSNEQAFPDRKSERG
jgi:hypothetical protein